MTTAQTRRAALSPAARKLLEERLRGRTSGTTTAAPAGIPRLDPRPAHAPLSAGQQRLYFLDQLAPGSTEYLLPVAWRIIGPLDTGALGAAVGDLVQRHEQLRVVFPAEDGVAAQRVLPAGPGLARVDLVGAEPAEVAAAVRDLATRPFDL